MPIKRREFLSGCVLTGLCPSLLARSAAADPVVLRPHTAAYRVSFKGIGAGEFELTLRRTEAPGAYRYETVPHPSLLARVFVSADSREVSEFSLGAAGVVPSSYHLDDGGSHRDDVLLRYDWEHGRVSGRAGAKPVNLGLAPGTQDVMSIRAAILYDLLSGKTQAEYPMIDQDELKVFVYHQSGQATMQTEQGSFETAVWDSKRKGADPRDKTWRYWYAPALGYLPVRADQLEEGHARLSFRLTRATLG